MLEIFMLMKLVLAKFEAAGYDLEEQFEEEIE